MLEFSPALQTNHEAARIVMSKALTKEGLWEKERNS